MGFSTYRPTRRNFLRTISQTALAGPALFLPSCPKFSERVHILGSGINGLCAGALLAKEGWNVHVLEAHPELIGGHAATLERDGFAFSVGPQYVWSFRDDGLGNRLLHHLGIADRVPMDSMDEDGFEEYRIGDEFVARVPMGLDRFEDRANELFPDDSRGLRRFFSYLRDLSECALVLDRQAVYRFGAVPMASAVLLADDLPDRAKARLAQCAAWSLGRLFDHCGLSQYVRRYLYGNGGIFLEDETDLSCLVYAAATGSYHTGADYPRYGFRSLIDALVESIIDAGGVVETGRRVTGLTRSGANIVEVQCENEVSFSTDRVISTLSPRLTFALLQEGPAACASYQPSHTGVCAFIGMQGYPNLHDVFAGKNIWWQDGDGLARYEPPDMTAAPRVFVATSDSAKGIYNPNRETDYDSVSFFVPGNFAQAEAAFQRDPAAHDELRATLAEHALDTLEQRVLPDVRRYLRFMAVDTPYDIALRTGAEQGNVYGRRLTAESLLTRPYRIFGIPNLHIACATTALPGVATAFRQASLLVEDLTGKQFV